MMIEGGFTPSCRLSKFDLAAPGDRRSWIIDSAIDREKAAFEVNGAQRSGTKSNSYVSVLLAG